MLTLNQIKKILQDWFLNHKQVRHFFWGNVQDYISVSNKEYTSINAEFISSNYSDKFLNHSFRIAIGDLINPNYPEQETEVISDSLSIANDFISHFEQMEGFIFQKSGSIQPFTDSDGDRISGIVFVFVLQVPRRANDCQTPIEGGLTTTTSTTIGTSTSTSTSSTTTSTTSTSTSTSTSSSTTSTSSSTSSTSSTTSSSTTSSTTTTSSSTTTSTTTLAPTTTTTTTVISGNSAKFKFDIAATYSEPGWVNVTGNPKTTDISKTQNGITLSNVKTNWQNFSANAGSDDNGMSTGTFAPDFPANVVRGYWQNYSLAWSSPSSYNLQLSGLNASATYTIKVIGSVKSSVYTPNVTQYRCVSNNNVWNPIIKTLNNVNNTNNHIQFDNVIPDSTGTILLGVNVQNGIFDQGENGIISALIVTKN